MDSVERRVNSRKISRIEKNITDIISAIDSEDDETLNVYVLRQHDERLHDLKAELGIISNSLMAMDIGDMDPLFASQAALEKNMFECGIKIKKLLSSFPPSSDTVRSATSMEAKGVRLPKLEVPTFDGQVVHWQSFWEQFDISIHSRASLSKTEKLVYLKSALKSGSARGVIEGLSQSGEHYDEAIASLKDWYNRPRLIHQAHVRMILEAPNVKDGTGRELRRLHDIVQQHLRAL